VRTQEFNPETRKIILIAIVCTVVVVYIIQIFVLQVLNPGYKILSENNAFSPRTLYPSRGVLYDRNGKLLAYNQMSYDVMVVMRETEEFDTLSFCRATDITIDFLRNRIADIKNKRINPWYSPYTYQTFLSQLTNRQYGVLQETIYKFPGFYIQSRPIREYTTPYAAHVLGYIAETDKNDIAKDENNYYQRGDFIGKTGVERWYEKQLRGEKGVEILLRDAHGRIKGKLDDGGHDITPVSGKDLTLSIDIDLQAYGEMLMKNKLGTIIMIEPKTGEILCMVSSPTYDPTVLVGKQYSNSYDSLIRNPYLPLYNRALMGSYEPGSTFKTTQALAFLQEGIITPNTAYSCAHGWPINNGKPRCHGHASPLALAAAIGNSCNAYFVYGLKAMFENKKYKSIQESMDKWRDHMVAQGFGNRLGVDLPDENRGKIPNSAQYDRTYKRRWSAFTVYSIAIGQGEVLLSSLQLCNLAATIANRGYFYTPHVVKAIKNTPLDSLYTQPHYTGIEPQYYETVVEGMRWAVNGPGGTSQGTNLYDIAVCGKTGTAENPTGIDHSIFMAFAPMDDPQLAILVFVENGGFGATNAVPIARLMIQKFLKGEIPASDIWREEQMKNKVILRNVAQKN
jgi:penicillin-binding protein 2